MTTPQEARHASFRLLAGGTTGTYNEDLIAASEAVTGFSGLGVNGQEMELLKALTGSTETSQTALRAAYAAQLGVDTWSQVSTIAGRAYDFTTLAELPSDITFTRASAGYYENSDGTLTAFASGEARLGDRGLLIEPARTNLLFPSQAFDNAAWTKVNSATVTADAAVAPDGTTTMDKLKRGSAATNFRIQRTVTVASGTAYVLTVYARADEIDWLLLEMDTQFPASTFAYFDLTNGVKGTEGAGITSAAITAMAGGTYRCEIIATASGSGAAAVKFHLAEGNGDVNFPSGNATDGLYLWQADLQAGAFSASPIKTEGSTVTRAADVATIAGIDSEPWFNASEGTVVVAGQFAALAAQSFPTMVSINDGTSSESVSILKNGTGTQMQFSVIDGGANQYAVNAGTIADDTQFSAALAYKADDFRGAIDGALASADTSGTIPTVDTLEIGARAGSLRMSGLVAKIDYYPRRLADAQIQALTA